MTPSDVRQCRGCWQRGTNHVSSACIILTLVHLAVPRSQDKLSLALERVELQSEEATFFQKQTNDKVLLIKVRGRDSVLFSVRHLRLRFLEDVWRLCAETSRSGCLETSTCILPPLPVVDDTAMTDEPPCRVTSS